MPAADTDPLVVLNGLADAAAAAINDLKASVSSETLLSAARLIGGAKSITVAGLERASPVAAILADGLMQHGYTCRLWQSLRRAELSQLSAMNTDDVLVAVSLHNRACPVANAVRMAQERRVRVVGITDWVDSPVAQLAEVSFVVPTRGPHEIQPLTPHIVLVQSLLIALGNERMREPDGSPRHR